MNQTTLISRGLRPEFVEHLNGLYDAPGSWWRKMVDTDDFLLAIRENYINFYYLGSRLFELRDRTRGNKPPVGATHYKFLLRPEYRDRANDVECRFTSSDIKIIDGKVNLPDTAKEISHMFIPDLTDIGAVKEAIMNHKKHNERLCVHKVALNNPNIIDVEVAFHGESGRPDFASFQNAGQNTEITFFEAKMISSPDLRADGSANPKVIDQIQNYAELLRKAQKEIIESYSRVCCNLMKLKGGIRCPEHHEAPMRKQFRNVAEKGGLIVNCDPRLVIFDPEGHQVDKNWQSHREKLVNHPKLADRIVFWSVPKLWGL